jgi:peptidoglycan-N-acetylglucosamine deacetylase
MIPFRTPFFLPYVYSTLLWRVNTKEKELFLTFDDGPVPGATEFVLDQLRMNSAKATFFCIGDNIRKHPHIFKKIIDGGHAVGNHTFNHLNGWKTPLHTYSENIWKCDQQIDQCGYMSGDKKLLRPPYGKITFSQIRKLSDYKIVMWDLLTKDYDTTYDPQLLLNKAIRLSRPGSIVVFHDSYKAEKNLRYVLPRFMKHFIDQGFAFKVIPS